MYTEQLSQALSIAAAPIHAQTLNNASAQTGAVDMTKLRRALFLLDVGTTGSGFSVTAKLQESGRAALEKLGVKFVDVPQADLDATHAALLKVQDKAVEEAHISPKLVELVMQDVGA